MIQLLLSLAKGRLAPWLALGLVIGLSGWIGWHEHNGRLIEAGRRIEQTRRADSTLALLVKAEGRLAVAFSQDTVRLTQVVHRTVTLRDTVTQVFRDTAVRWDTTVVYRYIHVQDSAISACLQSLQGCNQLSENRQRQIEQMKLSLLAVPEQSSCTVGHVLFGGLGVVGGFVWGHRR